jgi:hypothetical protein
MVATTGLDFIQERLVCGGLFNFVSAISIERVRGIASLDERRGGVPLQRLIDLLQPVVVHELSAQAREQVLAQIERPWLLPQLGLHLYAH